MPLKLTLRPALAFLAAAFCACPQASAYEFENAVPLTLGMQLGEPYITGVHIRLNGHEVDIAISLHNDSKLPQQVGFYAATPLFESLGEGEEYADKTFPELKAYLDGKSLQVQRNPRAFFLGQDITTILRKGGIGPIPSHEGDWKKIEKLPTLKNMRIKNWQGQVLYGWNGRMAPDTGAISKVSYSALPHFSLETIDTERFAQVVQKHCGQPAKVRQLIANAAPAETQVFAEVFEFPLPLLKLQDTRVTIERPARQWMGTRSIAALACGFDGALALPSDGMIRGANDSVSILVVSLLSSAPEEGKSDK
jgi:hypothetical protein